MRTFHATALVLTAAIALAACGGGDSDKDAEGNDDVKKTTLELGEAATLTGASNTHEIRVELDAEEGTPEDLKDFRLEDDEKKMTPWYVRTKVTNEGKDVSQEKDPWGFSPDVLDDGGLEAKRIGLLGDFERCELVNGPDPFEAGDSYETCSVYLVDKGATLDRLVIEETKFEGSNNEFTWKVGS